MKHNIIKSLLFSASLSIVHRTFFTALALGAMLLTTAVGCEKENNNGPAGNTDTVPQQPEVEPFSLSGTAWMAINDEWWSSSMHVVDTSIWRFMSDSTGIIYEHWIYNGDDPYGGETYPMTYTFDTATMTGILHGYQNADFSDAPIEFTYHPEDTTITYGGTSSSIITYHPLEEK